MVDELDELDDEDEPEVVEVVPLASESPSVPQAPRATSPRPIPAPASSLSARRRVQSALGEIVRLVVHRVLLGGRGTPDTIAVDPPEPTVSFLCVP